MILDQPTRLLDPECRHVVWDLIAKTSRKACVLMTTQSVEEAETLGDRIVLMRDGRVVSSGSPAWLKQRFGSGYCLRFIKLQNFV